MAKLLRLLCMMSFAALLGSFAYADNNADLDARVNNIALQLRCLVCQNQSIAESQADLANDLRREVREMLVAGKSEQEILKFMVDRYGDFVLYDPPVKFTTILLWSGPAVLLLAALGGFAWTIRQRKRATTTSPQLDHDAMARAQALLQDPTE